MKSKLESAEQLDAQSAVRTEPPGEAAALRNGTEHSAPAAGRLGWNEWLLGHLSRVTSSTSYVPEIDGLRFFAIASVAFLHLNTHLRRESPVEFAVPPHVDWLGWLAYRGGCGVNVFFGISGFILALPFAMHYLRGTRAVDLRSYYWRRLTRLEPPYIVSMLLFFALHVVLLGRVASEIFPNLLASMFYVHNIVYNERSLINGVAWSLEIEVQFYILAPLIARVYMIRDTAARRGTILALMALTVVSNYFFWDLLDQIHLQRSILVSLHLFLAGFLFADIYIVSWNLKPRWGSWGWDVVGSLVLAAILLTGTRTERNPDSTGIFGGLEDLLTYLQRGRADELILALLIVVLFVAVFRGNLLRRFFTNRWIATIGGMCYSIYLLHYAFIAFGMAGTKGITFTDRFWPNLLLQCFLIMPMVLIVSAIFFVLIERPCMYRDWPQRLAAWVRQRLGAAPEPAPGAGSRPERR